MFRIYLFEIVAVLLERYFFLYNQSYNVLSTLPFVQPTHTYGNEEKNSKTKFLISCALKSNYDKAPS